MKTKVITRARSLSSIRRNEDAFCVFEGARVTVGVVVDGHGRKNDVTVRYAERTARLLCDVCFGIDTEEKFQRRFLYVSNTLDEEFRDFHGGAVTSVAVKTARGTFIAWLGDVDIFRVTNGVVRRVSTPHHLSNEDEFKRLSSYFSRREFAAYDWRTSQVVTEWGESTRHRRLRLVKIEERCYVNSNGLAVTRGFGDYGFRPAVIAVPEVRWLEGGNQGEHDFLVIASDGMSFFMDRMKGAQIRKMEEFSAELKEMLQREKSPPDDATALFFRL